MKNADIWRYWGRGSEANIVWGFDLDEETQVQVRSVPVDRTHSESAYMFGEVRTPGVHVVSANEKEVTILQQAERWRLSWEAQHWRRFRFFKPAEIRPVPWRETDPNTHVQLDPLLGELDFLKRLPWMTSTCQLWMIETWVLTSKAVTLTR